MEIASTYRGEMEQELEAILAYWLEHAVDRQGAGFVGRIDEENRIYTGDPKGSVLNSRILWTFSAACTHTARPQYLETARRAFDYLINFFIDKRYGGVYWTVDADGRPLDDKKQIYALAFAVYGLSEYYRATREPSALEAAQRLHLDIVEHSHDPLHGGYIEALARDWQPLGDLRLSAKDANEPKSMNTHLHVLEAFANLYSVAPTDELYSQVHDLLRIFLDHIIDKQNGHLVLFFGDEWQSRSGLVSYGHDVEAAWLLEEAAKLLGDEALLLEVRDVSLKLATAAARGLDADGGLWYEYDPVHDHLIRQKHSWPQAEAMVGFLNAALLSGNADWMERSWRSWQFVKERIRDKKGGEWYWGIEADGGPMKGQDKVGIWKCPYHNTRACLEVIRRLEITNGEAIKIK